MKKQAKYTSENQMYSNLEKYQSIDVDEDWNLVKDRMGFRKKRRIILLWRAAAIAIVVLSIGFLTNHYLISPSATILAVSGELKKDISLPDGSLAFLNKNSTLTYPAKFRRNQREVTLTGEGYFEISSNPKKPFLVQINDRAVVEVLGTSFNIKAETEGSIHVQVAEGKVAFYASGNSAEKEILIKNNQAKLSDGEIIMEGTLNRNFLSWKTGKLIFDQDLISDVVKSLSTYYERTIILHGGKDNGLTFTSTIDNQDLESVLEELRLVVGISYSIDKEKVLIQMPE